MIWWKCAKEIKFWTENLEKIENREKQAEAEVVPSSSSVEVKLSVKVKVKLKLCWVKLNYVK